MSFPRYSKYKDSGVEWLGEVPAHWDIKRLKRACDIFPSNVDKKTYDNETPVVLCNYTDVYYNEKITSDMKFMQATATPEQIEKFTLQAGDTIITKDSETADDIAVAAYVAQDMPGVVCGYHLSIVRPTTDTNGAFVARLLRCAYAKAMFEVLANGLTRVGLGQYELDNIQLPFPPSSEQFAIAAFLDRETTKIDGLVGEQRRLMELLKEKRQAVISHAVTKGLNPHAPMKSSGVEWLGDVPQHWEVLRLGNVFYEIAEPGNDGLPILSVSIHDGVSDKEVAEEDMDRKVTRSEDRSKYIRVAPGDLVYNMMRAWQGGFGTVAVEGMVSPAYVVARPRIAIETAYIENLLRTPPAVEQMRRHSRGVTDFRLRLYWDEFKNIRVAVPPQNEAKDICRRISEMDASFHNMSTVSERAIALLQERRTALISTAVTGKIDVRTEVFTALPARKPYPSGFARQLLAAEILQNCHAQPTTGRVKLQKLIHLCEHVAEIEEVHATYERKAAGPFDHHVMFGIASGLKRLQWFAEEKVKGRTVYRPLAKAGDHSKYLARWKDKLPKIHHVLALLGTADTQQCEIVSTLYAAWNDLLIEGQSPSDSEIIYEASDPKRWHENKANIPAEKWPIALGWMRKKGLIPTGFGSHTKKATPEQPKTDYQTNIEDA